MTTFKSLFWVLTLASSFLLGNFELHATGAHAGKRDYYRNVTKTEKAELRYILTTLAKNSLTSLLKNRSKLQDAGDRIDHLHPLRFILTCFKDDELKGSFHCVHDRGKVWKEFFKELKKNFEEEASHENLLEEYVKDFAKSLKINASLILPALQKKQWDNFVEILLKNIPRGGEPDRYDFTFGDFNKCPVFFHV